MKKKLLLLALVLALALATSSCSAYNSMIDGMVNDMTESADIEEEEVKATVPPLTEPMYTDRAALYKYYNELCVGDTLESLTAKYGEPTLEEHEGGTNYIWQMEDGYGFCATFFDDGVLKAKVLYYDDLRQLGELSHASGIDNVSLLSDSYTLETVKSVMGGRGMQIAAILSDSSDNPGIQYLYCWISSDGKSLAQILFDTDGTIEKVMYSMDE